MNPLQLPALFTWLMTDNRKLADLSLRVKKVQVSTLLIYNIKLSFCLFCQPCSAADSGSERGLRVFAGLLLRKLSGDRQSCLKRKKANPAYKLS